MRSKFPKVYEVHGGLGIMIVFSCFLWIFADLSFASLWW